MIKMKANATSSKPKAKAAAKAKPVPVPPTPPVAPPAKAKKKPAPKRRKARKVKAKAAPKRAAPQPKPAPESKPQAERARTGGAPPKLTDNDIGRVIAMLQQCGGIKTVAAEKLNVGRTTLYAFLNEHPEIQEAAAEIDEELLDVAEGRVVMAIRAGEMQTVRWFLELKGKARGYVRRVETTGKDGGPVETQQRANPADYTDEELEVLIAAAQRRKNDAAQG